MSICNTDREGKAQKNNMPATTCACLKLPSSFHRHDYFINVILTGTLAKKPHTRSQGSVPSLSKKMCHGDDIFDHV